MYAKVNGFSPILVGLTADTPVRMLALYFAVHLRSTRFPRPGVPIKSVTVDQYITHVADALVTGEYILRGTDLRSQRLTMLLEGYAKDDDVGPLRLSQKIPVTYPIACVMRRVADTLHGGAGRLAMRAAIAVAYGLSLRPGEYLAQTEGTPLKKQMNASDCFFVFDDDECTNVCDPHLYPVGKRPSYFLCMFRKLKNSKRSGSGGPRAVGAKTDLASNGFCCVQTLYEYFQRYPGRHGTLALSAHNRLGVPWPDLRLICHLAAIEVGVDPLRLLPHSLRAGAQAQLEMESVERRMQQGGWNTEAGMDVYSRKALGHARAVAALLHDPTVCPLAQTRMLFNDHALAQIEAPLPDAARRRAEIDRGDGTEKDSCHLC